MEYVFSEIHPWQDNNAVIQQLVFTSFETKQDFQDKFKVRVEKDGIESADENGLGAFIKLRAVKNNKGKYHPIIRCGFNGRLLYEDDTEYDNPEDVLQYLREYISSK